MTKTETLPARRRSSEIIAIEREMKAAIAETEAIRATPEYRDRRNAELAEMLRKFSATVGRDGLAAEMLGLPKRTYDNIKQGRGFPYPRLLALAILAFEE